MINLSKGFAPAKIKQTKAHKEENNFLIELLTQDIINNGEITSEALEVIEEILKDRIENNG